MLSKSQKRGCFTFLSYLFILSVPFAVFAIVVASYFHYLPFKMEIHTLITIGIIFFIFLFFIPHNAYYSFCKIKNSFDDMEKELKKSIRRTLLKIGTEKKSTLKVNDFFKTYYSKIRNDNFASVATTIFPMLGILGTFVSIAMSMPDFSVTSVDSLDKEISVLLGGVGTAFYASIYGIFLSIWWLFFEKRGLSKIEKSAFIVEKAYDKYLWDDTSLKHFVYAQNQMHNDELVGALRENFNIHFMKQFNDSYVESYKTLLNSTQKSFMQISENIENASKKIVDTLDTTTKATNAIEATQLIDKRLADFNNALFHLDERVEKSLQNIDSEIGGIVKKLADFAEIVVSKSDEVDKSIGDYHHSIEKLLKK